MKLSDYLERLKDADAPMKQITREFRYKVLSLLLESFDLEQTPSGSPWKPLKRPRIGKILNLTGNLRSHFLVNNTETTITIENLAISRGFPYPATHQYGSATVPKRPFMPEKSLPKKWKSEIRATFLEIMKEYLTGE